MCICVYIYIFQPKASKVIKKEKTMVKAEVYNCRFATDFTAMI